MTTDTTTKTTTNILDADQLRAALLDLLTRAETALEVKPNGETAREYAATLEALDEQFIAASDQLAHALPALRILQEAWQRIHGRYDALAEVFDLGTALPWEFVTDIGERTFWGDKEPVFPALRMNFTQEPIDYNSPF